MTDRRPQFNRDLVVSGAVAAGLHLAAYLVVTSLALGQAPAITAESPLQTPPALALTIQSASPTQTQPDEPPAPLPLPSKPHVTRTLPAPPEPIILSAPTMVVTTFTPDLVLHEPDSQVPVTAPVPLPPPPTPTRPLPTEPQPPIDQPSDDPPEPGADVSAAPTAPPRAIDNQKPKYPRVARQRGYEGTVELRVHVLANGKVGAVELVESSGSSSLDRAAVRGVKRWRFALATRNGRAVDIWIEVPIEFTIVDK